MCMNSNFATFLCLKCDCSSLMAVLIMALSLAMTARSSPAVLHALTFRMRSRNLRDMVWMVSFVVVMHWWSNLGSLQWSLVSCVWYQAMILPPYLVPLTSDLWPPSSRAESTRSKKRLIEISEQRVAGKRYSGLFLISAVGSSSVCCGRSGKKRWNRFQTV
jgi:hypothetical protein